MTLAQFARLNQIIEYQTPTNTISTIQDNWENIEDKVTLIKILDMDYPMNNLGGKKAIKWVTQGLAVFEDEVKTHVNIHMDLGEGIYHSLKISIKCQEQKRNGS
jgi:hypothetical protein